jgi:hypothetical protein
MKIKVPFFIVFLAFSRLVFGFNISDLEWAKNVGARTTPQDAAIFNTTDFGAVPDGITLNTKAIQAAIDACEQAGGGVVTFSPGPYLTGAIYLKNNVHLHIPQGVTLLGSQHLEDYPDIPTRVAGIEMEWPSALINVIGKKNVMISGKGEIDGRGKPFWDSYWEMRKTYEKKGLRWIVDYDCKRPRTVLVSDSEDMTIKDLTFKRAGFWTIHLLYSQYCTIDGAVIRNNIDGHGPSTDGIDIDSSSRILVENCDIDCNDDNFCLKAGRDADGLRINRPTEYVVIRNCISRAGGGLLTCGSETSGGIRYVLAHNLKAQGTTVGIRFKSAMTRGGTVHHIYLKDIEMQEVGTAIEATLNWNPSYSYSTLPKEFEGKELPVHWQKMLQKVEPPELGIPHFNHIYLSDIKVHNAKRAFHVEGSDVSMIKNFYLKNIIVHAQTAGTIEYAENWTIEDVEIVTADRLPITISNCENVSFSTSGKTESVYIYPLKKQNHISILAAEFPDFIFHLPEMAGNLKFGIVKDGESKWIKDAEQIKSDLKNHVLTYRIADPLLNKGEITFKAISLKNTNGILIEVSANRLPENVHLFYTFGGAYGKVLSDDKPYALLPRYCKDNVFNVERTSFTLYYGESGNLKVLQGILPLTAEIRISDANRQTSPLALHNSGKKTDAPVLSAIIPLENNKKEYFCIYRQNAKADYNYFMLPELFEKESKGTQ